jgi:hypothetical protein
VELQDPDHIERLFNACAILHNILLANDGIDDWENRMKNARFDRKYDSFDISSVNIHQSQVMDDILYNEEGANVPSADFPPHCLDFHSNAQTDREMTSRLRPEFL